MIQMPTRIAITFQSTSCAASTSVMVPIQTMTDDAEQRGDGGVELVDDDGDDRHAEDDERQPLQRQSCGVPQIDLSSVS